jgi:hypothetical protein
MGMASCQSRLMDQYQRTGIGIRYAHSHKLTNQLASLRDGEQPHPSA